MAKVWKKLQRADGNFTGTIDGTAAGTIKSGAALGASAPVTFKQTSVPTALNAGDMWFDTDNNNKQYRATATGDDQISGSEWVEVTVGKTALGLVKGDVGLGNVDNDSTSTIRGGVTKANVGLSNVDNNSTATILSGNLTGTVDGTAVATVKSGAASGATANQDSTATILGGNLTGSVDGTAVGTIKSGAASGASAPVTFRQDGVPTALNAGDIWFDTNDGNKQYRATATGDDQVTSGEWEAVTASKGAIGLGNVSNESPSTLKSTMSLNNVENKSQATILSGNLTGTVDGTAVATVKSGAASGATANQDSTATILGGNLTGTIGGTAVATVKSGAASGATANQDSTATILGGNLTGTVDGTAVATVKSGAASGATANQDSTSTIRSGTTATHVGLGNVVNQAVTVAGGKLKLDGTAQTMDADTVDGDSKATIKAAAVTTAETNIIGSAPGTLNTLDEIAAALNDDASFNSTITTSIATKAKAPVTISNPSSTPTEDVGVQGIYADELYVVQDV